MLHDAFDRVNMTLLPLSSTTPVGSLPKAFVRRAFGRPLDPSSWQRHARLLPRRRALPARKSFPCSMSQWARMPPSDLGRADQSLAPGSLRPHGAGRRARRLRHRRHRRVRLLHRLLPQLILRARSTERKPTQLYGLAYEEVHHNMSLIKPGVGAQEFAEKAYKVPDIYAPRPTGSSPTALACATSGRTFIR